MKTVAQFRVTYLSLFISCLIAGIPAQFGGVAVAGTVNI